MRIPISNIPADYSFDNLNRQVGVQDALGYRTTTVFDNRSLAIAVVNPLGYARSTVYDVLQRPQASWLPDGTRLTTVYDTVGNPIASISPLGYITTQLFDARNRLIGRQDPLNRRHSLTYDSAGRLWTEQDAKSQITTHGYLNCGDEYTRLYADGTRLTFSYNSLRQIVGIADGTGLHTFSYDSLGRLLSLIGPVNPGPSPFPFVSASFPLTFGYDANGNRIQMQTWWGNLTYGYDPRDLLVTMADPGVPPYIGSGVAGGLTTSSYDARRQMVRQDFTNGTTTTTLYDPLMRAVQIRHGVLSSGIEIDHTFLTYDAAGRPILKQSQLGSTTYGYDSVDRLILENNPIGGLVSTGYDLNGRRLSQITPLARLSSSYDAADQLLTTAYTQLVTTLYQINCGGGTVAPYQADAFFTGGSVNTTSNTIDTSAISNPAPQAVYQSQRYASSFITYALPNLVPNAPYTLRLHFAQFDTNAHTLGTLYLNRMPVTTSVDLYELCGGANRANVLSFATAADNAGQLTIDPNPFYGVGSCYVNAIEVESVLPVGVPLVTTFSWDANGSLVGMAAPGGGLTTYSWDAANRLSSAVLPNGSVYNEVYRYDDLRQTQVGPLGPEVYLYDAPTLDPAAHFGNWTGAGGAGTGTAASVSGNGGVPNVVYWSLQSWGQHFPAQMLLHGPNLVRAVGFDHTEQARQRQYHLDAQGSVQATTQAGSVEAIYGTDAWGTVLTGNPGDPDWYTTIDNYQTFQGGSGYWQEVGLGLEYVRARWLNPNTGSWLSVDPVSGEPRYSYAHNMPTLRVDPSGRQVGRSGYFGFDRLDPGPSDAVKSGVGRPVPARRIAANADLMQLGDSLNRVNQILMESNGDYDKFVDDLLAIGRARWKEMVFQADVGWRVLMSLPPDESLAGLLNPVNLAFDGARASLQTFMQQYSPTWRAASAAIPANYRGYAPPIPGSAEFIEWIGGFLFGVAEGLRAQVPVNVIFSAPALGKQIREGIGTIIGLLRRSKNLFLDLYDCAHLYLSHTIRNFKEWIKNPIGVDFDNGEKTADVLLTILFTILGVIDAVKGIATIIKHLAGGGRLADLLAKVLGHTGIFSDGETPGNPRPDSADHHKLQLQQERAPFRQHADAERKDLLNQRRRNKDMALNHPDELLSKEEFEKKFPKYYKLRPITYGEELSRLAIEFRRRIEAGIEASNGLHSYLASSRFNVMIVEYRNPHTGKLYYVEVWSDRIHSESIFNKQILPQMKAQGISIKDITRIYTEQEPCPECSGLLRHLFVDNRVEVTYSFEYNDAGYKAFGDTLGGLFKSKP